MKIEVKARIEYVLSKKTCFTSLLDSNLKTVNGDSIFGTDINLALCCTCCIAADRHCLNDTVGIALKNGTIHECARGTLVGITYNILLVG